MKIREILEGVGRITKQNQTVDVGPGEVTKQAAKFGNKVDRDGRPPTLSSKVKGKSTNVLFNLGLAEGYKLQLERDREMLVLNITDTATGKRTEVRGKPGYETDYDPNDSLHILLDKVGKSANISELMNGEVVTINPKHPDADRAKAATDRAYNEETGNEMLSIFQKMHNDSGKNAQMDKFIKSHNWELRNFTPNMFPSEEEFFDYDDPFNRVIDIDYHHRVDLSQPIIVGPKFKDGKYSVVDGNHRAAAAQRMGKTIKGYFPVKQIKEAFDTDVEWIKGAAPQGASVFAAKVDDAYIEITYKPMNKGVYISFTRGARMSVTGEGSQNKIFGAVINHIKKWVDKNKPQEIYFSAFKPRTGAFGSQDDTRSGLYRKMVQRFASQNGYDYDVEDTGNEDTFILKRKGTDTQTNEALDQPYPVRWVIRDDDEWEGKAKTEAGDSIQIMITQGHNNHKWEVDFYVGGSMQVTGKGDQFRVFATVVSAVKKWWAWLSKSKQPVEAISFSAFKGNKSAKGSAGRSSLYNRFATQFARSIGFTVSTVDRADNVKFVLTNPNYKNQQTENFADGKKPGRKGLAKRSGVNTKASVSDLRKTAKNSSGEKQRMAHWLANMKSGRKK